MALAKSLISIGLPGTVEVVTCCFDRPMLFFVETPLLFESVDEVSDLSLLRFLSLALDLEI